MKILTKYRNSNTALMIFFASLFGYNSIVQSFIPNFFNSVGLSSVEIGVILGVSPLIAVVAPSFWGLRADRTKYKNHILQIVIAGFTCCLIVYNFCNLFWFLLATNMCYVFFQSSLVPLGDTICLEVCEQYNRKYNIARLFASLAYGSMALIGGFLINGNVRLMFVIGFILGINAFVATGLIPKVKGHQKETGNKMSLKDLFKYKYVILIVLYSLIPHISLAFYYTFFPVYIGNELGGGTALVGIATAFSCLFEFPFLLFANKIVPKVGVKRLLIFAGFVFSLRWLLFGLISLPWLLAILNGLHGFSAIIIIYCTPRIINENVPPELRATGQTLNGIVMIGISRVIGNVFGGMAVDASSIPAVFLAIAAICFVWVLLFIPVLQKICGKETQQ